MPLKNVECTHKKTVSVPNPHSNGRALPPVEYLYFAADYPEAFEENIKVKFKIDSKKSSLANQLYTLEKTSDSFYLRASYMKTNPEDNQSFWVERVQEVKMSVNEKEMVETIKTKQLMNMKFVSKWLASQGDGSFNLNDAENFISGNCYVGGLSFASGNYLSLFELAFKSQEKFVDLRRQLMSSSKDKILSLTVPIGKFEWNFFYVPLRKYLFSSISYPKSERFLKSDIDNLAAFSMSSHGYSYFDPASMRVRIHKNLMDNGKIDVLEPNKFVIDFLQDSEKELFYSGFKSFRELLP